MQVTVLNNTLHPLLSCMSMCNCAMFLVERCISMCYITIIIPLQHVCIFVSGVKRIFCVEAVMELVLLVDL